MKLSELKIQLNNISDEKVIKFSTLISLHENIIILGNGGSSAVASHISQDYTKQLTKRCFTFSDPSRLTCYINDYGMEAAYAKFLEEFSTPSTLVILISSSGESDNIYNAAAFCENTKVPFVVLTGFQENNKIREDFSQSAEMEYWVASESYGVVECMHQIFLHTVA